MLYSVSIPKNLVSRNAGNVNEIFWVERAVVVYTFVLHSNASKITQKMDLQNIHNRSNVSEKHLVANSSRFLKSDIAIML